MRKQVGFTLIELMIVVAIIAIIAAIAIPNLLSARLNANETSAISTLRNISSSQAQIQANAKIDVDQDGTGEFGYLRELSGGFGIRESEDGGTVGSTLTPPVLSGAFRNLTAIGTVSRSGYIFRITLPQSDGTACNETDTGAFTGTSGLVGSDLAETTWCALTWPANFSTSGNRSFFVNQTGDVVGTEDATYTGSMPPYFAGAAFSGSGSLASITGSLAVGTVGRDGNAWKQIN